MRKKRRSELSLDLMNSLFYQKGNIDNVDHCNNTFENIQIDRKWRISRNAMYLISGGLL